MQVRAHCVSLAVERGQKKQQIVSFRELLKKYTPWRVVKGDKLLPSLEIYDCDI